MKNIRAIHYILHLLFYILHFNNNFHLIVQMSGSTNSLIQNSLIQNS